jgi:hypothetical protein
MLTVDVLVLEVAGESTDRTCIAQGDSRDFSGVDVQVLQVGDEIDERLTVDGTSYLVVWHDVRVERHKAWWEDWVDASSLLFATGAGVFLAEGLSTLRKAVA